MAILVCAPDNGKPQKPQYSLVGEYALQCSSLEGMGGTGGVLVPSVQKLIGNKKPAGL